MSPSRAIDVQNGAAWRSRTVSIVRKCRCRAFKIYLSIGAVAVGRSNEVAQPREHYQSERVHFNGRASDGAGFCGINGSFFGLFHRHIGVKVGRLGSCRRRSVPRRDETVPSCQVVPRNRCSMPGVSSAACGARTGHARTPSSTTSRPSSLSSRLTASATVSERC